MIKTAMLMAAMTALFGFAGAMLGGFGGLVIALLVAVAMNVFAWYKSDRWYFGCMVLKKLQRIILCMRW